MAQDRDRERQVSWNREPDSAQFDIQSINLHSNLISLSQSTSNTVLTAAHDLTSSLSLLSNSFSFLNPPSIHPLSFPSHFLSSAKLSISHSLSRISNALELFNQASAFHLNSIFLQNSVSNQNSPQIIRLFAFLRESSIHQASLIHNSSLALNHYHYLSHNALATRSTFLSPSLLIDSLPLHQRSPSSLPLIEAVARDVGLECFRDSEDANLLMIAGKLMLIDIEIDPLNAGRVLRCRFSYSFGDDEARRDEAVDRELSNQLADVHLPFHLPHSPRYNLDALARVRRALEGFASSLRLLKALDELVDRRRTLNDSAPEPVDYFLLLRRLIVAYHAHFDAHPSAGLPLSTPNDYQLRLAYHSPASALDPHSPRAHTLSVAFTPSAELHLHHPIPLPCQPAPESLFTAILNPPIAINRVSAESLLKVSTGSTPFAIDPTQSLSARRRRGIRLEDLLVENTLLNARNNLDHQDDDKDWKVKRFGIKFKDQRQRYLFSFLREEEEEEEEAERLAGEGISSIENLEGCGSDSSDGLGFLVDKVQFGDLKGLLSIIKTCRRQAVLNELFESCFNSHTYLRDDVASSGLPVDPFEEREIRLAVSEPLEQAHKPPLSLAELLSETKEQVDLSIDIAINHGSYTISAQLMIPDEEQVGLMITISLEVKSEGDIEGKCEIESGEVDEEIKEKVLSSSKVIEKVAVETRCLPVVVWSLMSRLGLKGLGVGVGVGVGKNGDVDGNGNLNGNGEEEDWMVES